MKPPLLNETSASHRLPPRRPQNRRMAEIKPTPYQLAAQFAQETRLAALIFQELAESDGASRKPKRSTVKQPRSAGRRAGAKTHH